MTEQHNTEDLTFKEQVKLEWNTPTIDIIDINKQTLSGPSGAYDGFSFS